MLVEVSVTCVKVTLATCEYILRIETVAACWTALKAVKPGSARRFRKRRRRNPCKMTRWSESYR